MNELLSLVPLVVLALVIWLFVLTVRNVCAGAWMRVVAGLLGLLIVVAAFLLLPLIVVHKKPHRPHCMNHLHSIALAMKMYAMDHDGRCADSFRGLTIYLDNPKCFICDGSGHLPGSMTNVDDWTDYALVPGRAESNAPTSVLILCPPENHGGEGGFVLHVDGSVEWTMAEEFVAITNNLIDSGVHLVWPTNHVAWKKHWWTR